MSTNEPFSPWSPEFADAGRALPKQGRGCCFWGGLLAVAMLLLLIAEIGGTTYLGYRWLIAKALQSTDDQPMELPALALDEQLLLAVRRRWESFQESMVTASPLTGAIEAVRWGGTSASGWRSYHTTPGASCMPLI